MNTRNVTGVLGAILLFIFWVIVDMIIFPTLLTTITYPVYELIVYGSWFVIILIIVGILSWSEAIPNPYKKSEDVVGV